MNYLIPSSLLGKRLKVAIIGCGGTGSYLAEEIIAIDTAIRSLDSNSGLEVVCFDPSNVTSTNLVRQKFFSTQVGQNKAIATVWKSNNLYGKNWDAEPIEFTKDAVGNFDLIITCLDRPSTRYEISKYSGNKVLWLDLGNSDFDGQVILGELGRLSILPNICDLYDYSTLDDKDALIKSCSAEQSLGRQDLGVNATCARYGAQLIYNLMRHGSLRVHGVHFDIRKMTTIPIEISEECWAMYGYMPENGN